MYLLTIYNSNRVVEVIEYHEPPSSTEIERRVSTEDKFDISRKPIDDDDLQEYLNEPL